MAVFVRLGRLGRGERSRRSERRLPAGMPARCRRSKKAPRLRPARVELLLQQVMAGLATGGIYACMALAVVMIYQAIDHLNFAQGEMAMFSTFIAWQVMQWGQPYWLAFLASVVLSFLGGVLIERVLFRPIHNAPVLSSLVAFIALFRILNRA